QLDANERARLRQQALDWLRAHIKAYRQVLGKSVGKAGPIIAQRMQHWLPDDDFARGRRAEAPAQLPEAGRPGWRQLGADVAVTLAQAQEQRTPEPKKAAPGEGPKQD